MPADEDIGFDCADKINGFYASIKFGCQVSVACLTLSHVACRLSSHTLSLSSSITIVSMAYAPTLSAPTLRLLIRKLSFVISRQKLIVKIHTNTGIGELLDGSRFVTMQENQNSLKSQLFTETTTCTRQRRRSIRQHRQHSFL